MSALRCTCGEVSFGEETRLPTEPNIVHKFDGSPCHYEPPSLMDIVEALGSVYNDRGAVIWLRSKQFPRGTAKVSALDLIVNGRSEEVMDAVERLASGAAS